MLRKTSIPFALTALAVGVGMAGCWGDGDSSTSGEQISFYPSVGLHAIDYPSARYGQLVGVASITDPKGSVPSKFVFHSPTNPKLGAGTITGTFALNQETCFQGTEIFAGSTGTFRLVRCTLKDGKLTATIESKVSASAAAGGNAAPSGSGSPTRRATAAATSGTTFSLDTLFTSDQFATLFKNYQTSQQSSPFAPSTSDSLAQLGYFSYANLAAAYVDLYANWANNNAGTALQPIDIAWAFNNGNTRDNLREIAALIGNAAQETNSGWPSTPDTTTQGKIAANKVGAMGLPWSLGIWDEGKGQPPYTLAWMYGDLAGYCTGTMTNGLPQPGAESSLTRDCPGGGVTDYCKMAVAACADNPVSLNDFHGRGLVQLTHAYNYITYGNYVTPNAAQPLHLVSMVRDPDSITRDGGGQLGWETGLAYWALPQAQPNGTLKPTPHQAMVASTNGGFGQAINLINGAVDCKAYPYVRRTVLTRIQAYIEALLRLGVAVDNVTVSVDLYPNASGSPPAASADHVYTGAQLAANINNPRVKAYTVGGVATSANYNNDVQPKWTWPPNPNNDPAWPNAVQYQNGGNYLSHPLIQEYYASGSDYTLGVSAILTNVKKILLTYPDKTTERLDCVGYAPYGG